MEGYRMMMKYFLLKQRKVSQPLLLLFTWLNMSVVLLRWQDKGVIGNIHLHISETIKFRMPKIFERLMALQRDGTIQLSFAWSHKKITCMDTAAGCYVVEGSGNYGENAMEEQYVFLKSKKIYEFRSGRIS